ncbi:MAG: hypothetical protein NTV11_06195 [Rhodocyclales bacterium]|nr:hypothetical protein [Rhodocyclales bacterium]
MNCTPHLFASRMLSLVAVALLSACASTTPGGRSQLAAPEPISSLYSSLDLRLTLASLATVATSCAGIQCQVDKGFERQVVRLGTRLAEAAYESYPELRERIPEFSFVVAEKAEGGSSSEASGTIVIYRGVRKAALDEEALAWLIAREMGRVIARHHDEKSAATILSSLVAQVLLAPANLARGMAFIVSSTATAFGQEFVATGNIPAQRKEADVIALDLLSRQGWSDTEIADSLLDYSHRLDRNSWSEEVRSTVQRLNNYKSADILALTQPPVI